eukprot:COSAG01_NODE_4409_length_5056_cov_1.452895_2_plen_398_part_00
MRQFYWKLLLLSLIFGLMTACVPSDHDLLLEAEHQDRPIQALELLAKLGELPANTKTVATFLSQYKDKLLVQAMHKCRQGSQRYASIDCVENWLRLTAALKKIQEQGFLQDEASVYLPVLRRGATKSKGAFLVFQARAAEQANQQKRYRKALLHWQYVLRFDPNQNISLAPRIKEAKEKAALGILILSIRRAGEQRKNTYYQEHDFGSWLKKELAFFIRKQSSVFLEVKEAADPSLFASQNSEIQAFQSRQVYVVSGAFDIQKSREALPSTTRRSSQRMLKAQKGKDGNWIQSDFKYEVYTRHIQYTAQVSLNIRQHSTGHVVENLYLNKRFEKDISWRSTPDLPGGGAVDVSYTDNFAQIPDQEIGLSEARILALFAEEIADELSRDCLDKIDKDR